MKKSTAVKSKSSYGAFFRLMLFVYAVNFFFYDVAKGFGIYFKAFGCCGRFIGKCIKRCLLAFQNINKVLLNGIFAKKAVNKHIAGLPHAVGAGDSLIFNRWLELRFADNNNAGGLNVKSGTAGLNLCGKYRSGRGFFKFVDNFLAVAWRNRTVYWLNTSIAEQLFHALYCIKEKGENNNLSFILCGVFHNFFKADCFTAF